MPKNNKKNLKKDVKIKTKKNDNRYRDLIIFITLFLTVLISVLFMTYRSTNKLNRISNTIDISGTMSDMSFQILVDLEALALHEGGAIEVDTEEVEESLEYSAESFAAILNVLENGGEFDYEDGPGSLVSILPVTSEEEKESIAETKIIWLEYSSLIEAIDSAETKEEKLTALIAAASYGKEQHETIYEYLDTIYSNEVSASNDIAKRVKLFQIFGITVIILFFTLFVVYFLRKLKKADSQINRAQGETANILKTVDEGIFLLDSNQTIGSQHSTQLEKMFGKDKFEGISLAKLLQNNIKDKDLDAAIDYVEQLYNPKVKEKLIKDLNPLDELQTSITDASGNTVERFLNFKFARVYDNKQIASVLVSITDNTRSVELEKQLQREKEQNERQLEMLVSILKTDSDTIVSFTESTSRRLNEINQILKTKGVDKSELKNKINVISREIHSLKGEASALELEKIVKLTHEAEEKLKSLNEKSEIYGDDFMQLTVNIEKLMAEVDVITDVNQMLHQRAKLPVQTSSENVESPSINHFFDNTVKAMAQRQNKAVEFKGYSIQKELLSGEKGEKIKSIAIQLLGNAIVHGIETSQIRNENDKSPTGTVSMQLLQTDKDVAYLVIEDDGAGIDFDKVKESLIKKGQPASTVNAMPEKQLLRSLFSQGLTTAESVSEDAGRGIGLDIVAKYVKDLGGKLQVNHEKGKFTRFTIKYNL